MREEILEMKKKTNNQFKTNHNNKRFRFISIVSYHVTIHQRLQSEYVYVLEQTLRVEFVRGQIVRRLIGSRFQMF